jgi:hypothetical protein
MAETMAMVERMAKARKVQSPRGVKLITAGTWC